MEAIDFTQNDSPSRLRYCPVRRFIAFVSVLACFVTISATFFATDTMSADLKPTAYRGENPYEPIQKVYETDLLIVGGSSAGTAAALTAGRQGIETVWTLRAPRDIGGLSTNVINPDTDISVHHLGGYAMELDTVARYKGGRNAHNQGWLSPFHHFFNYTKKEVDRLDSLTILSNLYPVKVVKDATKIVEVVFGHRIKPGYQIRVRAKIVIDAEIEGDLTHLAGVSTTLCREGSGASDDPTRDNESYAGKIFTKSKMMADSVIISGGPKLLPGSTNEPDKKPATMAYSAGVSLQDFGAGDASSPWILKREPKGYRANELDWWKDCVYGVNLGLNHRRWDFDRYLSVVEGWRLPDGRHMLESFDIRDREANEKFHLQKTLCKLYHLQHVKKKYNYGLSQYDFYEGLTPKYRLSDFGTTTNAGDAPLPGLIYMREGRRMVNDHVYGGKLIEDDGSGRLYQKRYWHPRTAYFNAMVIDIHGVHNEFVPESGPEGMQFPRLAGYPNFGVPCIPADVFMPRESEATNLLVASAGAYTHEAYSAFPRMETGRILQGHACATIARLALKENIPPQKVDIRRAQIVNLIENAQSLVYFEDTIPGTFNHLIDQMLGCRRVPEQNSGGVFQSETSITADEAKKYLTSLFVNQTEEPISQKRFDKAVDRLKKTPISRADLILSLGKLLLTEKDAKNSADSQLDLAETVRKFNDRGWTDFDLGNTKSLEKPIRFSEFKQLCYNGLFGPIAPETVRPVRFQTTLAYDTFNRPNGPLDKLESGQKVTKTGDWTVHSGSAKIDKKNESGLLLVDVGQSDYTVRVDLFLNQTTSPAVAGLVVRAEDGENMQRFLLETQGEELLVRIETVANGQVENSVSIPVRSIRRGWELAIKANGPKLGYYLGGKLIQTGWRSRFAGASQVGLINESGKPSIFDNFQVIAD
jgi:FAD-dependent oxidoreductase family protein